MPAATSDCMPIDFDGSDNHAELSIAGTQHRFGADLWPDQRRPSPKLYLGIKLLARQQTERQDGLLERGTLLHGRSAGSVGRSDLVCLLGGLGRVIVTQGRVKAGHEHQGLVQELIYPLLVGDDADDAVLAERGRAVAEQPDRLQQVLGEYGLEDVELAKTDALANIYGL